MPGTGLLGALCFVILILVMAETASKKMSAQRITFYFASNHCVTSRILIAANQHCVLASIENAKFGTCDTRNDINQSPNWK